ncbi:hypothetical protein Pcinc_012719 [Petrolisthes cinctipes]|uniref:Uncharacterized protein n=1 Tax=Petrolisthes cinctipes TaxID=88211 RepID=A0AAE1FY82_PETCI|nr:hypothetical protein Pcinc_012719 [Petrolisthes cinctipes]
MRGSYEHTTITLGSGEWDKRGRKTRREETRRDETRREEGRGEERRGEERRGEETRRDETRREERDQRPDTGCSGFKVQFRMWAAASTIITQSVSEGSEAW